MQARHHSLFVKKQEFSLSPFAFCFHNLKLTQRKRRMIDLSSFNQLCQLFANIVGGSPSIVNGACLIQKFRKIPVTILGRRSRSPLVLPTFFSFESLDRKGRALNLGETVILQERSIPLLLNCEDKGLSLLPFTITGSLKSRAFFIFTLNQWKILSNLHGKWPEP